MSKFSTSIDAKNPRRDISYLDGVFLIYPSDLSVRLMRVMSEFSRII